MKIINLTSISKNKSYSFLANLKACIILSSDKKLYISPWICVFSLYGKRFHNNNTGIYLHAGNYIICMNRKIIQQVRECGYKGSEIFDFRYSKSDQEWQIVVS